MDLTIHIDDAALDLFYQGYHIGNDFGPQLDEKQKKIALIEALTERLYGFVSAQKQSIAASAAAETAKTERQSTITITEQEIKEDTRQ